MKPDPLALKNLLRKRESELQNIMKQMKQDNLDRSKLYKNLESELESLKNKVTVPDTNKS
jgi:hypothetical protein